MILFFSGLGHRSRMSHELLLGVNIDHSATLRQARYREHPRACGGMVEPDPVAVAQAAERAGADGITLHLREDRRHIQDADVRRVRECIATQMNLEMACTPEMLETALKVVPECVLLVPEGRDEVTTEGGRNVVDGRDRGSAATDRLHEKGIAVSLFIDAVEEQIRASAETGADRVELHTGGYANAASPGARESELIQLVEGAMLGHELGLKINAGHGINYHNITGILRMPHLRELNIGHSVMSRALFVGIDAAVRDMKALMLRYKSSG